MYEAVHVARTKVLIPGASDHHLAADVEKLAAYHYPRDPLKGTLTPARGLTGPIRVRPMEALLRLARATAPNVPSDVYKQYEHWAYLRYLGTFDVTAGNRLTLSDTGRAVYGNQRRVLSEEIGIGFSILLAEAWCRALGVRGAINALDVDQVLRGTYPNLNATTRGRQPDYLLQYADPLNPGTFRHRLLESKGTKTVSHAKKQLARGVTQLGSLELNGGTVEGVAISIISANDGVSYLAVDPDDNQPAFPVTDFDLEDARRDKAIRRYQDESKLRLSGDFLASATATTFGSIADFAGAYELAETWMPPRLSQTLKRKQTSRLVKETHYGPFVGHETLMPAPGTSGVLRVFQGAQESILRAMGSRDLRHVAEAQQEFASELGDDGDVEFSTRGRRSAPDATVGAVAPEGTCLFLEIEA